MKLAVTPDQKTALKKIQATIKTSVDQRRSRGNRERRTRVNKSKLKGDEEEKGQQESQQPTL